MDLSYGFPFSKKIGLESKDSKEGGFALVTVLLLASLLMVILVGLLFMTDEEGARASLYKEGEEGEILLEIAFAEVKAKLMDGGEIPYRGGVARTSMTACPGLMEVRRYDVLPNRGYQMGREAFMDEKSFFRKPFAVEYERSGEGDWQPANPQWIALYSQKWYAPLCRYMTAKVQKGRGGSIRVSDLNPDYNPERVFNFNTPDNPFRPGRLYFGGVSEESVGIKNISLAGEYAKRGKEKPYQYRAGESSVERPLYVQWIPIYRNPQYGAVLPNGEPNVIVGRYAYWVDVENTKINNNSVKRNWERTALGQLTGISDGSRGGRGGDYFEQWAENEKDTPRYSMEYYKPRAYQLFRDRVPADYGVELYYQPNYGRLIRERGKNYAIEEYEQKIFEWEDDQIPPAIADHGVVDWKIFNALRPVGKGIKWLESLLEEETTERKYNLSIESYAVLDPAVESMRKKRGKIGIKGFEKMYGQGLTVYGWEEERDPLGRPKLDINAILREGDALFDRGRGLPESDHEGTPLQQLLARLYDKEYYLAYYSGAYPSRGEKRSFVDGLKAFAGRGANADKYGEAMLAQMVTNIIGYGREHKDPPFLDKKQGIVEAKSMPYVAEVAIRARNALWDLWDNPLVPYVPSEKTDYAFNSKKQAPFPGFDESEVVYSSDFSEKVKSARQEIERAQKIALLFLSGDTFNGFLADSLFTRSFNQVTGGYNRVRARRLDNGQPDTWASSLYYLLEIISHVVVDVAFGLSNPSPLGRDQKAQWEIEMEYSWFDPKGGGWPSYAPDDPVYEYNHVNPAFLGADGTQTRRLVGLSDRHHFCSFLLPNERAQTDQLGSFFGVNDRPSVVYFRSKPERIFNDFDAFYDSSLVPGELVDGVNLNGIRGAHQCFRLHGWKMRREGSEQLYHQVPLRHPGQQSSPRPFWAMTVDRDGNGPLAPPNCGVLASTESSHFGLEQKEFRYPDLHSLEHFRNPANSSIQHLNSRTSSAAMALPFGLGLSDESNEWEVLKKRKNVAASWFSSQTIAEFNKHCESLMLAVPPDDGEGKDIIITISPFIYFKNDDYSFTFEAPEDPRYFYHVEQELVNREKPPFRGLEGKLYIPQRAIEIYREWIGEIAQSTLDENRVVMNRKKVRLDIMRFMLLQMKLRDEAMHHAGVANTNGRPQISTGRNSDDDFVSGMALVERIICIDPVVGHRTGNDDLLIKRNGLDYRGHFYGVNGHPWRKHHYYYHHYDKDNNSPQSEILRAHRRPEPSWSLTDYFSDPRRTDGVSEPQYESGFTRGEVRAFDESGNYLRKFSLYKMDYGGFQPRKIPLRGVSGSVLQNAVLTLGKEQPNLRGERGWARVSDIERDNLKVWPYGPGMKLSYGYQKGSDLSMRMAFRNGSLMTHAPRGELMTSIGEIGLCHSGFLQRSINLDRPPIYSAPGAKRLGDPQYGPPMSMLIDLLTPSNYRDSNGNYLSKEDWSEGKYRMHAPENPRIGVWNVNSRIAQDHYLAVREGAHGTLSNHAEIFLAHDLDKVALHPALVPSAVGKRKRHRKVVGENDVLDPYLNPLVHFRRGWEHWLGAIAGDYSAYRNMGAGVWNKGKSLRSSKDIYTIAQGIQSFSWHPRGAQRGGVRSRGSRLSYVHFSGKNSVTGKLFTLGKEYPIDRKEGVDWNGLSGHVSADGPLGSGAETNMYDRTRYALFPMVHHISEVGYMGLGKMYTALNSKSRTTSAYGGFQYEQELVDNSQGGDGILGGMSQAGFARNAPWVMSGNQLGTSANVFTVHIVTQSLRERDEGVKDKKQGVRRKKRRATSTIRTAQSTMGRLGYMDENDEILGERWAQVVVTRLPKWSRSGKIVRDRTGAPQYDYRILSKKVKANER